MEGGERGSRIRPGVVDQSRSPGRGGEDGNVSSELSASLRKKIGLSGDGELIHVIVTRRMSSGSSSEEYVCHRKQNEQCFAVSTRR